jgi:hypothetical protein
MFTEFPPVVLGMKIIGWIDGRTGVPLLNAALQGHKNEQGQ